MNKAIVTCSLTGVLTDPKQHPVPVTAAEMASSARDAYNAGASIMHIHFRNQEPGKGHLGTWDTDVVAEIAQSIRAACPGVILNFSTGVVGKDYSGPLNCLERCKPHTLSMESQLPPLYSTEGGLIKVLDMVRKRPVRPPAAATDKPATAAAPEAVPATPPAAATEPAV